VGGPDEFNDCIIDQREKTERTVMSSCGKVILLRSHLSQLNAKCLHSHETFLTEVDSFTLF
jgi:hypothetical protein